MRSAFIYTDEFSRFDYGSGHPLKPARLKLTYELILACGLLSPDDPRLVRPVPARRKDLLSFHTKEYLDVLEAANNGRSVAGAETHGLGYGDNPVFPGIYNWSTLVAGASLLAADLVDSGEAEVAFNTAGGLHHAQPSHASGFCYVNDPVLAIKLLVDRGRRVAYIDIDAHHGDGVQDAFYGTDRVLAISLHETGRMLFPGTGFEEETGSGAGAGYSINIPLPPETDDELFVHAFCGTVPMLIDRFRPDVIVSQLGVDTFRTDPLAHMNITTNGFFEVVRTIASFSPRWVALGGGGYDIANVARAWTLAWALMNGVDAPVDIPGEFLRLHPGAGFPARLRDEPFLLTGPDKIVMKKEVDRLVRNVAERAVRL